MRNHGPFYKVFLVFSCERGLRKPLKETVGIPEFGGKI
jgi:hypothetical protein